MYTSYVNAHRALVSKSNSIVYIPHTHVHACTICVCVFKVGCVHVCVFVVRCQRWWRAKVRHATHTHTQNERTFLATLYMHQLTQLTHRKGKTRAFLLPRLPCRRASRMAGRLEKPSPLLSTVPTTPSSCTTMGSAHIPDIADYAKLHSALSRREDQTNTLSLTLYASWPPKNESHSGRPRTERFRTL